MVHPAERPMLKELVAPFVLIDIVCCSMLLIGTRCRPMFIVQSLERPLGGGPLAALERRRNNVGGAGRRRRTPPSSSRAQKPNRALGSVSVDGGFGGLLSQTSVREEDGTGRIGSNSNGRVYKGLFCLSPFNFFRLWQSRTSAVEGN